MAGRGWGRGRGRGGPGYAKQLPFEIFPEVNCIDVAKYSVEKRQLIKWSTDLHRHWKSSPYFYVDRKDENQGPAKTEKPDIERFSNRESLKTKDKAELRDFIMLDPKHMPGELSEGQRKRKRKKVVWNPEIGMDVFEKLEKMQGNGEADATDEEEEEEDVIEEEDGEFSDEGDYEQNRDFDDDEDDFNVVENDDEPIY